MIKFVQVVWSRTNITLIALAIIISGVATTQNASAREMENTDDQDRSVEREKNASPSVDKDNRDAIREERRAAMELKKQELRTAQDTAKAQLEVQRETDRAMRQEKLSASKLEICKSNQADINNRISRIADRSAKHLDLFNRVSERTQAYYTKSNRTVASYDQLVADVEEKKMAAEAAVDTIHAAQVNFVCEEDSPKVAIEEFKISLQTSIEILKEYRTSVKNLIVGIKSAQTSTGDDSNQTESAE